MTARRRALRAPASRQRRTPPRTRSLSFMPNGRRCCIPPDDPETVDRRLRHSGRSLHMVSTRCPACLHAAGLTSLYVRRETPTAALHQGNHMLTQPLSRRDMPARPNYAPAYYLGRPAAFWITVMSPSAKRAAVGRAPAARHLVLVPRPALPQAGETIPPTPRLSAVYWTPRPRRLGDDRLRHHLIRLPLAAGRVGGAGPLRGSGAAGVVIDPVPVGLGPYGPAGRRAAPARRSGPAAACR